jgi:HK97 family phage major capsid protein
MFADIREDEARAKGYIKGHLKKDEVFSLLKRSTTPTTIYKKQKLDRDDIIDITDFDVVAWIKGEMRIMLDEEIARAILVGDGRLASDDDHINEENVRPIWKEADLFCIKTEVTVGDTDDATAKNFIRACIKSRKDYRGSGNPTLFTTEDMLTDLLLLEDSIGHKLYKTESELATALRVSKIVTVPVMENLTRQVTKSGSAYTNTLKGIIVNLNDYKVGADKGGSINMFEDFDIDYNQEKYLIETRISGCLVKPFSAIVLETSSQG